MGNLHVRSLPRARFPGAFTRMDADADQVLQGFLRFRQKSPARPVVGGMMRLRSSEGLAIKAERKRSYVGRPRGQGVFLPAAIDAGIGPSFIAEGGEVGPRKPGADAQKRGGQHGKLSACGVDSLLTCPLERGMFLRFPNAGSVRPCLGGVFVADLDRGCMRPSRLAPQIRVPGVHRAHEPFSFG